MGFRSLFGLFSDDLAIDLGTANTLVYARGQGIVVNEPSIVAINRNTGKIEAVGHEAKEMLGRTPGNIVAIKPMKDGVIADFDITEEMLKYFIKKAHKRNHWISPIIIICIPSEITQVDKRSVRESALRAAASEFGKLDILINNAGLGGTVNVVDMTDEQWHSVLDITLTGTFRMTRAVLPHMIEHKSGVIVNNASVLGWRAQVGQAHYAAAKAGVMALTRCSALEVAEHGVRINAVSPSFATHPFLVKTTPKETLDQLEAQEAFGRGAQPFEVANVMVFLASDYSSYMTGETVAVSSQRA